MTTTFVQLSVRITPEVHGYLLAIARRDFEGNLTKAVESMIRTTHALQAANTNKKQSNK